MRIFVFGNINAGKSFVVKNLSKLFSNYQVLKIDEYRIKYGDCTVEGEQLAQNEFVKDVSTIKDGIIEATGYGSLGQKLAGSITYRNSIILKITAPLDVCLQRLEDKDFSQIPYPQVPETIDKTIERCHIEFQDQCLEKLWRDKVIDIITIDNQIDIQKQLDNIPLEHYNQFSKIIDLFIDNKDINSIISYGSLGRGELTKLSDIDMYLVTKLNVEDVLNFLENSNLEFWFSDNMKSKITLKYKVDNLLIEIIILERLSEGEQYYLGSRIENVSITIYKISDEDYIYLQDANYKNSVNIKKDVDYLVKEMIYYLLSLENIIKKQDWYKYYFHNNIILHNYIRLKALLADVEEYNYLPIHALRFIHKKELDFIFYDLNSNDYNTHYQFIFEKCFELLKLLDNKYNSNYSAKYENVLLKFNID